MTELKGKGEMTELKGKVALVTGSTNGIGKAIAERYASLGASVVVNYASNEERAAQSVDGIRGSGGDAVAIRADITEPAELETLFDRAIDHYGKLDIVVANAGVELMDVSVLDTTEEQFDRLFAINAKGTFFTLKYAGRRVADHGRIIHIGSTVPLNPVPGHALYGASKVAGNYVVQVLAAEVGPRNVTVNTIVPTIIEGAGIVPGIDENHPIIRSMAAFRPLGGRLGRPSDIADAAQYLAGDLASWVSGQQLIVSGGAPQ
jgi:3-oxoacyl-[acyl-carrier protein] reductase